MRRELHQYPVTLTGDSDRIHRKAIVHAPPERLYRQPSAGDAWPFGIHVGEMQPTLGPFLCRVAASLQTARTKQERSTYSKVAQEGEHFSRHL
jgi:hypothetical protein